MSEENKKKDELKKKVVKKAKVKPARQEWKPHWSIQILQNIWMVFFTAVKIAVGAAATVAIICVLCPMESMHPMALLCPFGKRICAGG
jgi:hypothetical protein